jgi:hypothetical protein
MQQTTCNASCALHLGIDPNENTRVMAKGEGDNGGYIGYLQQMK